LKVNPEWERESKFRVYSCRARGGAFCRRGFDDLRDTRHHIVTDMLDDRQVVRDEQIKIPAPV
jgi:hypothetical protein